MLVILCVCMCMCVCLSVTTFSVISFIYMLQGINFAQYSLAFYTYDFL